MDLRLRRDLIDENQLTLLRSDVSFSQKRGRGEINPLDH
jgi:hypothetical protein